MLEDNRLHRISDNEISLLDMSLILLKKKKLIGAIIGSIIIITIIVLLIIPNEYQSKASILPTGNTDKFSELKSLAGIGMMSSNNENSSALFPEILKSRQITTAVLDYQYKFKDDDKPKEVILSEYFDLESPDKLHEKLLGITEISLSKKTGVISLGVITKYPELSYAILTKYIEELEKFNLYKRASQAKDNEEYLAKQLADKKKELEKLEGKFEEFQKNNRDWMLSSNPEINMEIARFKRKLEISTKAVILLHQEYEMAKLEALKDVPIVRILDSPSIPDQKEYPKRALFLILITMISSILTCLGVIVYELVFNYTATVDNELSNILKSTANRMNRIFSPLSKKDKVDI